MRGRQFRNAVSEFFAALVGGDQFGQKTDRYHLAAQQKGGNGIDQQGPFMQGPVGTLVPQSDDPRVRQIQQSDAAARKTSQADAPQQVLGPLSKSGQEFHGEQVQK